MKNNKNTTKVQLFCFSIGNIFIVTPLDLCCKLQGRECRVSDVNECVSGSHTCNRQRGTCTNLQGSYKCTCLPGYSGDGRTCNGNTPFKHIYIVATLNVIVWDALVSPSLWSFFFNFIAGSLFACNDPLKIGLPYH